jgi:N6-L-threonylcarbamoyladenine synthase
MPMNILGIETSCDETAAAVVKNGTQLLSNIVASQDDVHSPYGGIVPELASRAHIEKIQWICERALHEAKLSLDDIDGIAVTSGPGLIGSLLVGLSYAKALGYAKQIPFYGINHLEAHLHAVFMEKSLQFPYVGLLVSGGHTALYDVRAVGDIKMLGTTLDDAAGEAFDKVAKLLGLGYPGGRKIDEISKKGNPEAFKFPRAIMKDRPLHFSYSGLKTSVLTQVKKDPSFSTLAQSDTIMADLCASFQEAVIDPLLFQSLKALEKTKYNQLVVAGGVAANSRLRERFEQACQTSEIQLYIPSLKLCTDNAAMVAALGFHYIQSGKKDALSLSPYANCVNIGDSPAIS